MSSEERQKVIQMVADGKISAEEALILIRALHENDSNDETQEYGSSSSEGDV